MKRLLAACGVALAVAACNDGYGNSGKSLMPIPPKTMALMSEKGMAKDDPILVRVYKKESELEVWKRRDGQYAHLKTFPICRWSGQLGPKTREGDRQAPEGFYTVSPAQMNPNSSFHLSFDTGYPNAFDRSHNRSGSHLMVHGNCSSRGCYAMTDEGISEVYALAREAFSGGQRGFQLQAYPFRMTAENLARYRQDPHMPFWKQLKQGNDHFEVTKREPKVAVCAGRYAFDTVGGECKPDPTLAPAVAQKDDDDRRQVAELVAKGTPAVRLVYADGGGHESFRSSVAGVETDAGSSFAVLDTRSRRNLGDVSRPEALAEGPREIVMNDAAPKVRPSTALAAMSKPAARDGKTGGGDAKATRLAASVDPEPTPATSPSSPPEKPFYQRMMGRIAGSPAEDKQPVLAEPVTPSPPARRTVVASLMKPQGEVASAPTPKAKATPAGSSPTPAAKPRTSAPRQAEASLVAGAAPIGPSPTGFSRN